MKLLFASLIAASTIAIAAPAMAQSVYVGPGGVGVGIGGGPYDGGYYRGRGGEFGRGPAYEGRSVYRSNARREYRRHF